MKGLPAGVLRSSGCSFVAHQATENGGGRSSVARPARWRTRSLVLVGDEQLSSCLARTVLGRRHPVARSWTAAEATQAHPNEFSASVGRGDVLVVDAQALPALWAAHANALMSARRIVVVTALEPNTHDSTPRIFPLSPTARCLKRALDLVIAPAALLLVSPVVLVCLLAIRVDSKGPVFFRQIRVGEGGRLFLLYKLRTMLVDTDESSHAAYVKSMIEGTASRKGTLFKLVDDPRVTRVGRVLRRLSLDEVPQLWNVIKGDMTLVGPRPPLPREVDLYDDRSWERLYVKPGLTGLWQVSGRSERSFHEMIDLDIAYWRSWSVGLEFRILVKTLPALVTARGAA